MPTHFFRRLSTLSRSIPLRRLRSPLMSYARRIRAIYHVTQEEPQSMIQRGGFKCSDPYANIDVKTHVERGGESHYVSTTRDYELFLETARIKHQTGVYIIDSRQLETTLVDYDRHQHWDMYRGESEVLVPHEVPLDAIVGAITVNNQRQERIKQPWLNPHYHAYHDLAIFLKQTEDEMVKEETPPPVLQK